MRDLQKTMPVSREHVLQVLSLSRKTETAVGIRIKGRLNLLITHLENITGTDPDNTMLTVAPQSIYGEELQSSGYPLEEIDQIFNLRIRYNDPFYQYLRTLRTNIKTIREGAGFRDRSTTSF